jgi:predicted nuclease with TOPRIM domain
MTGTNMVTDIRIVVEGLNDVKKICAALENSSLGSDYGASITSIIPTTDTFIAVNAASGADIVLVAMDADSSGRNLSDSMNDALQGVCSIVENIRLPQGQNVEYYDSLLLKESIEKAIIRSGLKALKLLHSESESYEGDYEVGPEAPIDVYDSYVDDCGDEEKSSEDDDSDNIPSEEEYDAVSWMSSVDAYEDTTEDDSSDEAIYEANELRLENQRYMSQISDLENRLNDIMINSYEKYNIEEVWESLYPEQVPEVEELLVAASRLSDEVFISGNFIFAQSLRKVEDFLKEFRETFN